MPENSWVYPLTNAHYYQDAGELRSSWNTSVKQETVVYIYAPEQDVITITDVLNQQGIHHAINRYDIREFSGKTVCFFKRYELSPQQSQWLKHATRQGAQVQSLMDYLDQHLHYAAVELLHTDYLFDNHLFQKSLSKTRQWQKRLLDINVSALLLIATLPFWLAIALAIKLESSGPIFFLQRRTGLFNREFTIIKFRSMYQDAEKGGARWASKNDERITRVGRWLRKMRLDELPQVLNVLKGDMSLIGPRPEREIFIKDLEPYIPFYRFRHVIKPGITGLAQVKYTYGASLDDAIHKHRHDIYYIKHQNISLDCKILANTMWIMLTGRGI